MTDHPPALREQLSWMKSIEVGTVLRRERGPFRVVREVSRYSNGDLRSVTFVIRRCSWTHRCYTILNYTDLRVLGYRPVPVKRRSLRKRIDRKIHAAIHQPSWERKYLTCCEVEGVS